MEHYRVPITDALIERGTGTYSITLLGPLQNGKSTAGEERSYFRDLKYNKFTVFGQGFNGWPDALDQIESERPDVIIIAGSLRTTTCWKLPALCRRINAIPIAWSKIHSFSNLPKTVTFQLKRLLYSRYEFVICYGKQSRDELVATGFPEDRACVAQNTIDTHRIFNQGNNIIARGREIRANAGLDQRKILLCVARMNYDKRHEDLLAAWPQLRSLDNSLVMVMVGGGPRLEEIRAKAHKIDPDNIIVTGRVPAGDDYAWIAVSDVTVFPGAVGLAINQSLAFGRPTIIADEIGADTEIIEHDVTGWRYPRGNINALVDTIRRIGSDEALTTRVTEQARCRMRDEVTIENMVLNIDAVIRRALELKQSRR